jgi:hypothetical protein
MVTITNPDQREPWGMSTHVSQFSRTRPVLLTGGATFVGAAILGLIGCADKGTEPVAGNGPPPPQSFPTSLTGVVPTRTVVSDTVVIAGTGFGSEQGDLEVRFTGAGGPVVATILEWSDVEVRALVPSSAISGEVVVGGPTGQSNALLFAVAPRLVSYAADVDPIFGVPAHGCKACHTGAGNANFVLGTREELLRGDSDHGPVALRRRGEESALIQKLRGTADFGVQMPFGGTPLDDELILTIADWIDQGTRDN